MTIKNVFSLLDKPTFIRSCFFLSCLFSLEFCVGFVLINLCGLISKLAVANLNSMYVYTIRQTVPEPSCAQHIKRNTFEVISPLRLLP